MVRRSWCSGVCSIGNPYCCALLSACAYNGLLAVATFTRWLLVLWQALVNEIHRGEPSKMWAVRCSELEVRPATEAK
ncbi:hypothetical protein SAMN05216279_12917 [Pseudomonas oryzihabitans]|uniref:Uncharacterized protein n=1 Tax=Pseudomonas oryzihabitans TaxID=47885 RepID=A0A1G5PGL0_9PSED|nr:hypothetical protein SAMN05216279_12917 [Pseudomonas psychrotolerans]